ncbi:MAG: C25 family cysteine peptidase [Kiritimatiellia bacterium]
MHPWSRSDTADYLRLGVFKDGVYCLSSADIAAASGETESNVVSRLSSGGFALTCGNDPVSWTTDGTNLFFYGQSTDEFYAPENVYFLRPASGVVMTSRSAAPEPQCATNRWFMQSGLHRADFLDVTAYFDRRSSDASIIMEKNFGMSLGDSMCNRMSCEFDADVPGYFASASTNIVLSVSAVSYGDYGDAYDIHCFEVFVEGTSCGSCTWSGEQSVVYNTQAAPASVTANQLSLRVTNPTPSEHILLLDVELTYPRLYEVNSEPLLCFGGTASNICVTGLSTDAVVKVWDITDPQNAVVLDSVVSSDTDGWRTVFQCGDESNRYAVFEKADCSEPSVTGFSDINWYADGAIPSLVIITPPRRWVSGFEEALEPLVLLRRAQGLSVRVVDAEEIYNEFSHGLVTPHAFQDFVNAGVNSGSRKLRYLLFAGYASTDYQLEVFYPDTVFKNGKKGFPALFPLLQHYQFEALDILNGQYAQLLLPCDMMLGDADRGGVPDVAVGRFLATDAAELSNMVAKTLTHDLKNSWNRAVLVSGLGGEEYAYYNFSGFVSDFSCELASAGWNTNLYSCSIASGFSGFWKNDYAVDVWDEFMAGRDFFYYLGHSSDTVMGHSESSGGFLLKSVDLQYAEWDYAPFAFCMGCRMGRYTSLDVVNLTSCLMETAVKNPSSAFSAVITSSGYVYPGEAQALTELFSDEVNLYGAQRLGDAWCAALEQTGADDLAHIEHVVLLGDPSMPLYKPYYPTVFKLH